VIRLFLNIALVLLLLNVPLAAQSESSDEIAVLKMRWDSVAESVLVKIPGETGNVILAVEERARQSVIENSFIAGLQRRAIAVTLGGMSSEGAPVLRISGIDERGGQPSCDARWEGADGSVQFLGRFVANGAFTESVEESSTVLERIFEPLVVLAGTVLIVYLFFTVRS